MKNALLKKINDKNAKIGIIGMGYVGLPLLLEFAKGGFNVLGFDIDDKKIESLKSGVSYIRHIPSALISEFFSSGIADATTDFERISDCDAILIAVPTPLTASREPDLSYVTKTAEQISPYMRPSQLVVLESTTYPGTTEEVMIPILEKDCNLKAGEDFFVAYSPEREDPNNTDFETSTIPKVVGGLNPDSLEVAIALYDTVICKTIPVASCRTAEATKLLENIFRCINIAMVNELKMVFSEMDIDIWEVVNAASTKPFGFMPFYPGPGLGGHCIPIDPFYLSWKAKQQNLETRFIELAGEINTSMPDYVVNRAVNALKAKGKDIKGAKLLIVGLAYKQNVDDDRESPSYHLWEKFLELGAEVDYFDPYCPEVHASRDHAQFAGIKSQTLEGIDSANYDIAVISTAHNNVDHDLLATKVDIIVDSRGICKPAENVVQA